MNGGERGKFPRGGPTRVPGLVSLERSGIEVGRGWNTTLSGEGEFLILHFPDKSPAVSGQDPVRTRTSLWILPP